MESERQASFITGRNLVVDGGVTSSVLLAKAPEIEKVSILAYK